MLCCNTTFLVRVLLDDLVPHATGAYNMRRKDLFHEERTVVSQMLQI